MVDVTPVTEETTEITIDSPTEIVVVNQDTEVFEPTPYVGNVVYVESIGPIPVAESEDVTVIVDVPPRGFRGETGPGVELQSSGTHIQWREAGSDDPWVNLVALSDITGPEGDPGEDFLYFSHGIATGTVSVPGAHFYGVGVAVAGTQRHMVPFEVDADIEVSKIYTEVLFTGTETTLRVGIVGADATNQPTGSVLLNETLTVTTSGVKSKSVTPFTIPRGRYLLMYQGDNLGVVTLRAYRSGSNAIAATLGSQPIVERYTYQHSTAQAMDTSQWSSYTTFNFGVSHAVLLEYTYV